MLRMNTTMKNFDNLHGMPFYGLSRDNYISSLISISKADSEPESEGRAFYNSLTDAEKADIVTLSDGRRMIRKYAERANLI